MTNTKITARLHKNNRTTLTATLDPAIIRQTKMNLTATLDPAIIRQTKMNLYELAIANGFTGSFDDFLLFFKIDMNNLSELISSDENNGLILGSDNKLYVNNSLTKEDW